MHNQSNLLTLYIVRHAESTANAENRIQGRLDYPLSLLGYAQAYELRDGLKTISFKAVFSSPLKRALETAQIIRPKFPIRVDERLVERDLGVLSGLTMDEARLRFPSFHENRQDSFGGIDGVESLDQLWDRAQSLHKSLLALPTGCYLIVSHGIFISTLLRMQGFEHDYIALRNTQTITSHLEVSASTLVSSTIHLTQEE